MVSIAHASAPHDLTFISLRRKGFNQDFIKRYLCNALRPPATGLFSSFIFSRGLCSRRKEKVLFESSSRENVQFPEIGLEGQSVQRCQGSTYSVSSWRAEKLSQRTPKQRWAEQNLWPTMARVWILLQNIALQQFPLLLLPYSEG